MEVIKKPNNDLFMSESGEGEKSIEEVKTITKVIFNEKDEVFGGSPRMNKQQLPDPQDLVVTNSQSPRNLTEIKVKPHKKSKRSKQRT